MRIRQLDAIRGIAILVVILHNQRDMFPSLHLRPLFDSGWMGVDLFFVLSGFLITGILLDTKRSDRFFTNFYARRCLRIWPLYYALLAFMFVVVPLLRPRDAQMIFERSSPWWAYPLFLQNFLVPVSTNAVGALAVTWSLAIEEQFYLVWPVVVRYCSLAQLRRLAITVICLSPLLRLYLSDAGVNLYTNVFCRLDGLMAGALVAALVRTESFVAERHLSKAWLAFAAALPLALAADAYHIGWIVYSLSAAASAAFVYVALVSPQEWLRTFLTNRFLAYTGTISYGLYLLHKIPFDAAKELPARYPLMTMGVLLATCYAVAGMSWVVLERPVLSLKRFFQPERERVAGIARHVLAPEQPQAT